MYSVFIYLYSIIKKTFNYFFYYLLNYFMQKATIEDYCLKEDCLLLFKLKKVKKYNITRVQIHNFL